MIRALLLKARLHLAFYVLTKLSHASPPLPERTCQRFARSAAKRDPHGSTVSQIIDIMAAGSFDREFCLGAHGRRLRLMPAIREYLFRSRSGIDPRKPEPGFHPQIFSDAMSVPTEGDIDPYIDFLRRGRPKGAWLLPVIRGGELPRNTDAACKCRTALHIHAYYIDQLHDIMNRVRRNKVCPDLFISIKNEADRETAISALQDYRGKVVDIKAYPNSGRDIGPMLTGFGKTLLEGYEIIGHVHTKGSLFASDSKWVADWSNSALSNTIGGEQSGPMIDCIVDKMRAAPDVGIVWPADPHIPGWGVNKTAAMDIARSLGLQSLPEAFDFPIGTMFWIRNEAFRPFVDLNLQWDDYPKEPIPNDGTMLHALERLFGVVPAENGWKTVLTHTQGVYR